LPGSFIISCRLPGVEVQAALYATIPLAELILPNAVVDVGRITHEQEIGRIDQVAYAAPTDSWQDRFQALITKILLHGTCGPMKR